MILLSRQYLKLAKTLEAAAARHIVMELNASKSRFETTNCLRLKAFLNDFDDPARLVEIEVGQGRTL